MSGIWNGLQELLGGTLSFFYDLVPNFGIAIILLTILIGLILFPLTLKQTRSMKAMQEIQPEVKRLQKEMKHDRQAQQQAMMELYREKGVNPAAGCLPLILQMPIWFALFSVLRSFGGSNPLKWVPGGSSLETAVELAGEGGHQLDFLWMDLTITPSDAFNLGFATAIPYLLVIGLVMITAYWQQRQTMARATARNDGQQQQQPGQAVMKIFPFFFGFISFSLPAGLVVYFAASQMFRIGQQAIILGLDERRSEDSGQAPPPKTEKKAPEPEVTDDEPASNPAQRPEPKRRPQGSKKKRGKKRRR
jgi:YidC/Oxa1 family membrane protein insertase